MKVTDTGGDTSESEQVDDDTHLMLMEFVTACTENVNLDESGGPNNTPEDVAVGRRESST